MKSLTLFQELLHSSDIIHEKLIASIKDSQNHIRITSAWFTDDDVLSELVKKQIEGVFVEVIIGENEVNKKLNFQELIAHGGKVYCVKKDGYGMMHHKFFVFDEKMLFQGSYNITMNARLNNHESVIITNDQSLIHSAIKLFNDTKEFGKDLESTNTGNFVQKVIANVFGTSKTNRIAPVVEEVETVKSKPSSLDEEFEEVIQTIIETELDKFDTEELINRGHQAAFEVNGSSALIQPAIDRIYADIRRSISNGEGAVRNMETKLDEQLVLALHQVEEICQHYKKYNHENATAQVEVLNGVIFKLEKDIEKVVAEIEAFKKVELRKSEEIIKNNELEIAKLKTANPKILKDKFNLWFSSVAGLLLLGFIFLFYSSAGYIMFFSGEDAANNILNNIIPTQPSVFNPQAFSLALDHGASSLLLIILVVIVPILVASLSFLKVNKWGIYVGAVVVDFFIALKVSQSAFEVNKLIGNELGNWGAGELITDSNFYMVFVFGTGSLVLLHTLITNIYDYYRTHKLDLPSYQTEAKIKAIETANTKESDNLKALNNHLNDLIQKKNDFEVELNKTKLQLTNIPLNQTLQLEEIERKRIQDAKYYTDRIQLKKALLVNFQTPVFKSSLKNRFAYFLEGWTKFLNEEFSQVKALEKTIDAQIAMDEWLHQNLKTTKIDGSTVSSN